MDPIVAFLNTMQVLQLALVAAFLIAGIVMLVVGLRKRRWWLVIVGSALAFGQFVVPWLANTVQGGQVAARRAYVRNLATVPLPADYPRRLIVDGDLRSDDVRWLLAAGYVDTIDVADSTNENGVSYRRLSAVRTDPVCREAALATFDPASRLKWPNVRAMPAGDHGKPFDLQACARDDGPSNGQGDAVILRLGNRTLLFDRENARRNGAPTAIQLSLRRGGQEQLVHYDEMPILSRPASATQLMPETEEYPCPSFDHKQILANRFDAARQPAQAAVLLKRAPERSTKYVPCIESEAPRPYSTDMAP